MTEKLLQAKQKWNKLWEKKRQPNNHDSPTAMRSRNKSNRTPEKSVPDNGRGYLSERKEKRR